MFDNFICVESTEITVYPMILASFLLTVLVYLESRSVYRYKRCFFLISSKGSEVRYIRQGYKIDISAVNCTYANSLKTSTPYSPRAVAHATADAPDFTILSRASFEVTPPMPMM